MDLKFAAPEAAHRRPPVGRQNRNASCMCVNREIPRKPWVSSISESSRGWWLLPARPRLPPAPGRVTGGRSQRGTRAVERRPVAVSSDLGSILPLPLSPVPPAATRSPLPAEPGGHGNLGHRVPRGWPPGSVWTGAFMSTQGCRPRRSVSPQPRDAEPPSL